MLTYEWVGDPKNPPVAFLHGFMGCMQDWDKIVNALRHDFSCLVIDLPGHGKSLGLDSEAFTFPGAARRVAQVLESTDATPVSIVGYSMGGRFAMYMAVHYPHLCSAIVVESAMAGITEKKARADRRALDETWARKLEQGEFEEFIRTWYSQPVFASLAGTPALLEEVIKHRRKNDPKGLAKALRGFSVGLQPPLWKNLSSTEIPVLLITGEKDRKYVGIIKKMGAKLPLAHIVLVPGVGHNVHVENPTRFVESVKDFLLRSRHRYGNS